MRTTYYGVWLALALRYGPVDWPDLRRLVNCAILVFVGLIGFVIGVSTMIHVAPIKRAPPVIHVPEGSWHNLFRRGPLK